MSTPPVYRALAAGALAAGALAACAPLAPVTMPAPAPQAMPAAPRNGAAAAAPAITSEPTVVTSGAGSAAATTVAPPATAESAPAAPRASAPTASRSGAPNTGAPAVAASRKSPPAGAAPAAPATPAARPTAAEAAARRPTGAPSLDLGSLEQRLRDTSAIGLFTKLSLKNQVDDLLGQFRAYYRAQARPPTPELRQRYDLLLMKVLSLVQDRDPPLAAAIASSREALWGILADPDKLSKI